MENFDNRSIDSLNKDLNTNDVTLSKTKIININDFIFRQNRELYDTLKDLSVNDNVLEYRINGQVVAQEALTFDLRTLPNEAWFLSSSEFMQVIKINKETQRLLDFQFQEDDMQRFLKAKSTFEYLTEYNKNLVSQVELQIARLPQDSEVGIFINSILDNYLASTKEQGNSKSKVMALQLKNNKLPSLIEEEQQNSKFGFVNIFILLYGILNVGFIIAVALIK